MTEIGLSLGSNVGDKVGNLERALELLFGGGEIEFLDVSSIYRTAPWGYTEQDWFANLCAVGRTALAPEALLAFTQGVEQAVGRQQTFRWGPRVIDVDILYYDSTAIERPELTIPHREILNRAFVLVPLAEIRPDLMIRDRRVADVAAELDDGSFTVLKAPWRPATSPE